MRAHHAVRLGFILCVVLASTGSQATASPADAGESSGTVLVEGKRLTVTELKAEIDRLDDRFFERFNEINTIPAYETRCFLHAPLGTRVQNRYCHPVFMEVAREKVAQTFLQAATEGSMVGGGGALHIGMQSVSPLERKRYLTHLVETTLKNPELLALREERYKLIRTYEIERRKSGRPQSRRDRPAAR